MLTKTDFKKLENIFVTKRDFKKELSNYPTKRDLKKELSKYATKDDLNKKIDQSTSVLSKEILELFTDVFEKLDKIDSKLNRDNLDLEDHEKRINFLEKKVFHTSTTSS